MRWTERLVCPLRADDDQTGIHALPPVNARPPCTRYCTSLPCTPLAAGNGFCGGQGFHRVLVGQLLSLFATGNFSSGCGKCGGDRRCLFVGSVHVAACSARSRSGLSYRRGNQLRSVPNTQRLDTQSDIQHVRENRKQGLTPAKHTVRASQLYSFFDEKDTLKTSFKSRCKWITLNDGSTGISAKTVASDELLRNAIPRN